MRTVLCIPTLNAEKQLPKLIQSIQDQTQQPEKIWIIDSSSTDATVQIAKTAGWNVHIIPRKEFNHGHTRSLFMELEYGELYLYLTQDALPGNSNTFKRLLEVFKTDSSAGLAYGRQLPHPDATPFGAHARIFNYPEKSVRKTLQDSRTLGIKTPFCSNSFAAYRLEALKSVGGFPSHTILSEDAYAAAKMLLKGWSVQYVAEAIVYHSHDYSIFQEFKRYFDLGVFYSREKWIREAFGNAEGEGKRFLLSELRYLKKEQKVLYFEWFFRNAMKWLGYRLGFMEAFFPTNIKKKISMHVAYWG